MNNNLSLYTLPYTTRFDIHLTFPFKFRIEVTVYRQGFHNFTYFNYQCEAASINGNGNSLGGNLSRIIAIQIVSTLVYMRTFVQEQPPLNTDYVCTLIKPHLRWYDRLTHRLTWKRLRKGQLLRVELRLRIQRLANDGRHVTPPVIWEQICKHLNEKDIIHLAIALA